MAPRAGPQHTLASPVFYPVRPRAVARTSDGPVSEQNQEEDCNGQGASTRQSGTEEAESRQAIHCIDHAAPDGAADAAGTKGKVVWHMNKGWIIGSAADTPAR